ncbi:hypothetical protein PAECIP111893_05196 [Paenibacillus plantiphilus]|uniref:Uncharacterized protein n=1 Tax=Paenibacillus plantiphilus TaxID=2905650 RepID=A0ABM9CV39_9BACL|nr:hypothetical protein [Paenibacillus plantiphilus]CAH1224942.1 hypothetical protein PAECIP111893_05196 [Paenibacillus plantiphilus]
MLEKVIVMIVAFGLVIVYDLPNYRRNKRRERIVYWTMMMIAAYLGLDFMLNIKLPHADELLDITFTWPARMIFEALQI